jgi:hypothetical protein
VISVIACPLIARLGQANRRVRRVIWDASLRSDGGISGPPYSVRSLAIARARVGESLVDFPTRFGRSVQGRLQVLRL